MAYSLVHPEVVEDFLLALSFRARKNG